jgi:hypothetical protein
MIASGDWAAKSSLAFLEGRSMPAAPRPSSASIRTGWWYCPKGVLLSGAELLLAPKSPQLPGGGRGLIGPGGFLVFRQVLDDLVSEFASGAVFSGLCPHSLVIRQCMASNVHRPVAGAPHCLEQHTNMDVSPMVRTAV